MHKELAKLYDRREELSFELVELEGPERYVVEKELERLEIIIDKMEWDLGVENA